MPTPKYHNCLSSNSRRKSGPSRLALTAFSVLLAGSIAAASPNIVLIMTDDQGYGQTGYYGNPYLKTPNLDAMAAAGLQFDRFYAGAPVCSPTRASVLTGRTNDRTGVQDHGFALRQQEKTLPEALKEAGYATGHFGKWHMNGLKGPGVPILADDPYGPGAFGFDQWLSVTNYFDLAPMMSRNGEFKTFEHDSSAVIVEEALDFIKGSLRNSKPFFAVIWDGSPHEPFKASKEDMAAFEGLDPKAKAQFGELVAFDRSLGVLRKSLRELGVAENTIVWYCSDNGGLKGSMPDTVGGLRGHKGTIWEGGLRVPAIIEWPGTITRRTTDYPACTMDIFPTLASIVGLPGSCMLEPADGIDLTPLFKRELGKRKKPIGFRWLKSAALIDNDLKLACSDIGEQPLELYDIKADPKETTNIASARPEVFAAMKSAFEAWNASVDRSEQGKDYPEGRVSPAHLKEPHFWWEDERYQPYLEEFQKRPEYNEPLTKALNKAKLPL